MTRVSAASGRRLADAALVGIAAWRAARAFADDAHDALGMANAWGDWLEAAGLGLGAASAAARHRRGAAVALASAAAWRALGAAQWRPAVPPGSARDPERPPGTVLRVWSGNLLYRQRATEGLLAAIARWAPDVLLLQELTPELAAVVDRSLAQRYPHRLLAPDAGPDGFGVCARHPVSGGHVHVLPGGNRHVQDAVLHHPLGAVGLQSCHLVSPTDARAVQRLGMTGVATLRRRQAADVAFRAIEAPGAALVCGDFNASPGQAAVAIVAAAATDAWPVSGVGLGVTWPRRLPSAAGSAPPLLRLDYAFSRPPLTPLRARVERGALGSDHCPLVVDYGWVDR